MKHSVHIPKVKLTTKLLVLQVLVLVITLITTVLISIAYSQDVKWVKEEKPKFKSKYEAYYDRHIHVISHRNKITNASNSINTTTTSKPPVTPSDNSKLDQNDCDIVSKHEHSKVKKKPPHEHGHTFSPRFEETMIASILCNGIVLLVNLVNLGLCIYFHTSTYRRIVNGSMHLVGCWFILLSINIGIGQMINVELDYLDSKVNNTNEWINHDFIGCSIRHVGLWKAVSKIDPKYNKSIKPDCKHVQEYFYHNKSGIYKYDIYLHQDEAKYEPVYFIEGFNSLEDYAYSTGLCQLWTHKLSAIILNFIALVCAIAVVRTAFKVYRPGEVDPDEVVPVEHLAFVEIWVDDSIEEDELLKLTEIIEKQELLDTDLRDFNLELKEYDETYDPKQRPQRYSGAYSDSSGHRYYVHMRKASSASALSIFSSRSRQNSNIDQPNESSDTEGIAARDVVSDTEAIRLASLARRKSSGGIRRFRVRRTAELERFLNSLQHTTETLPAKAFH